MKAYKLIVAGITTLALMQTGCSGDSASTTTAATTNSPPSSVRLSADTFPTGLAVASPTTLTASTNLASIKVSTTTYLADLGKNIYQEIQQGRWSKAVELTASILPISPAYAVTTTVPEGLLIAQDVVKVLDGTRDAATTGKVVFNNFLAQDTNDNCFAPGLLYATHQDGGGTASGNLPSGDTGIWTSLSGSTPCTVAQLEKRVTGVKGRMNQALIMMAWLRDGLSDSGVALPTAGASVDATVMFNARVNAEDPTVTVSSATIALNSLGTIYTYRVVAATTTPTARKVEIKLLHTPTSSTVYSGVLTVTKLETSTDMVFGCTDQVVSTGIYKVATVNTVRYSRNADAMNFGSRSGQYCGAEAASSTDFAADVASFDSNGVLDPTIHLNGSSSRGATKGWRGNFARFSGSYNLTTFAGNFLYSWQAGNMDSHSRTFAANATYDSAMESRAAKGFFAYSAQIQTSDGMLLGMICNWAGPGNIHTPKSSYQYQATSLAAAAANWAAPSDNIVFAPTNSCNSTSTQFDVNANGALDTNEGVGIINQLVPVSSGTVQAAIEAAGFSKTNLVYF